MTEKHIGKVVQVTGPVLDIRYKEGELPALLNAIEIDINGQKLIAEVAQQIGDDVVRCIAMSSTDGLVRGTDAVDTGSPITVPVGDDPNAELKKFTASLLTPTNKLKLARSIRKTIVHVRNVSIVDGYLYKKTKGF